MSPEGRSPTLSDSDSGDPDDVMVKYTTDDPSGIPFGAVLPVQALTGPFKEPITSDNVSYIRRHGQEALRAFDKEAAAWVVVNGNVNKAKTRAEKRLAFFQRKKIKRQNRYRLDQAKKFTRSKAGS
jgi:hypothetical protein